jgi:hypothetical protein
LNHGAAGAGELVLIPAGYLAHRADEFLAIVLASTVGSLVGASFNYAVAMWVDAPSRTLGAISLCGELLPEPMRFFRHGAISTFQPPDSRHPPPISIPAGLTA